MEINFDPEGIKKLLENMENSQLKNLEEGVGATRTPISMVPFDSAEANGAGLAAAMADFQKDNINANPFDTNDLDLDKIEFDDVDFRSNFPKRKKELSQHQDAVDKRYKHDKDFGANRLNEFDSDPEEGPQPGDAEYHNPGPSKKQHGVSRFKDIDWVILHDWIISGKDIYASDLTDSDEGMMTYEDLNLLKDRDVFDVTSNHVTLGDPSYMNYDVFYQAVQDAWAKGFSPSVNDNSSETPYMRGREIDEEVSTDYEGEKEFNFDRKSLYHFLQDAFDQLSVYNEAEAAKILEEELLKYFDITKKSMTEGSVERIKDSKGVDITNKARVVHNETGAVGNVMHPGVNNGQQTIFVAWLNNPLEIMPPKEVLPTDITVDDDTRIVREATSHAIPNGRSANAKPETFPGYFERDINNKGLSNNGMPEISFANILSNTEYDIMANARAMNAQKEDPLMNIVPKPAVETIKYTMYEREKLEEGYDFASDERDYHNQLNHQDLENYSQKAIEISNPNAIVALSNNSEKRLNSIMDSLKEELDAMRVKNNTVIATDYLDMNWIFNINKVEDGAVYVTFKGNQ